MIRSLINLPFKVLGRAAKAVQDRQDAQMKARHGSGSAGDDFEGLENVPQFDTPEDFAPGPTSLGVTEVRSARDRGDAIALVDLRAPAAFAQGAIPGAENQPVATLGIRLAELPPAHVRIVVYCEDGGHKSREAARFLRFRGIEDSWYLGGGLTAWTATGGTTAPGNTPTQGLG